MTKPTQAQIEAAAKELCKSWPKVPDGCAALCMDRLGDIPKEGCRHAVDVHGKRAEAALTAAAQVEDARKFWKGDPQVDTFPYENIKAEYQKLGIDPANPNPDGSDFHLMNAVDDRIAAAQVGEPLTNYTQWDKIVAERNQLRAEKAITIERCAQVAEQFVNSQWDGNTIAAAIRKLKNAG